MAADGSDIEASVADAISEIAYQVTEQAHQRAFKSHLGPDGVIRDEHVDA
jgi:hypothetical protein